MPKLQHIISTFYIGLLLCFGLLLQACSTPQIPFKAVKPFEPKKYLGRWYEIARMDFRFEKNLNQTTAEYSALSDNAIKVINKGYDTVKRKWKQSVGKAKFVDQHTEAQLKVSFFGPFYAPYTVVMLDDAYQYALVAGKNHDYLWILARTKTIPESLRNAYLKKATDLGFDVSKLVWVQH